MLLAGHLQIAFYGLIAAGCTWLWETILRCVHRVEGARPANRWKAVLRAAAIGVGVLAIAFALAAPLWVPPS